MILSSMIFAQVTRNPAGATIAQGWYISGTDVTSNTGLNAIINGDLTGTGNIAGATYGSTGAVSDAEFLFVDGVTSGIQGQINALGTALWTDDGSSTYITESAESMELRKTGLATGFTSFGNTDAYVSWKLNDADGGFALNGMVKVADAPGAYFRGLTVQATPTEYPMIFAVGRQSGGTWSSFAAAKKAFAWNNSNTNMMTLTSSSWLRLGGETTYHQLGIYDSTPTVCLTDTDVNLVVTSAAEAQDTNSIWFDVDDTTPSIGFANSTGDQATIEIAATGELDIVGAIDVTGDITASGYISAKTYHATYSDTTTQTITSTTVAWPMTFGVVEEEDGIAKGKTSTVTISNATPAVVTWAAHGLYVGSCAVLTTDGALPTGFTAGTRYYIIAAGFAAGEFQLSATPEGAAINTSDAGSGTHTATNSSIMTLANAGHYSFIFSTICDCTSGNGTTIDIWFRKNGTNVVRSNTRTQMANANNLVISIADIETDFAAGDKVEMMWVGSSTNNRLLAISAQASPTRPVTPSTILTVKKISK